MESYQYIFGPVPSRRLGASLGISPLIEKTCICRCVYCQLGSTIHWRTDRSETVPLESILSELDDYLQREDAHFDVASIVGEGEPTLYSRLGELIHEVKKRCEQPVCVITNGILLSDPQVRSELMDADIVMPSLDAYNAEMFDKLKRPDPSIDFSKVVEGLIAFSHEYKGQLWLETMLVGGINDSKEDVVEFKKLLKEIRHQKLYLNVPLRPPAEGWVKPPTDEALAYAAEELSGVVIDAFGTSGFYSAMEDDWEAVLSIIARHPMNNFELSAFLKSRNSMREAEIVDRLTKDERVEKVDFRGMKMYRLTKSWAEMAEEDREKLR